MTDEERELVLFAIARKVSHEHGFPWRGDGDGPLTRAADRGDKILGQQPLPQHDRY